MRFTTLVVAAFASTALAVPTSLEPMTKRTTGIEPLTKRMEKCGQFTESRYLVIGGDGKPIGINGPIGTIEGNNNCQNLDNPNGDKQFYFELFGYCEWCKFYYEYNCNNFDGQRDRGNTSPNQYWNFQWVGAKSFRC